MAVATLIINISLFLSGWIFSGFEPSVETIDSIRWTDISIESLVSGKDPARETTCPDRLSDVVIDGSS